MLAVAVNLDVAHEHQLVSDIEIYSHCEHHVVPFVGKAHVADIPDGKVVRAFEESRVSSTRLPSGSRCRKSSPRKSPTRWHKTLTPQGTAVILQCQHFCMCYRGVRKPGSWTTTTA